MSEGKYRLRFVDGQFDALLEIPLGSSLDEWRDNDREQVRQARGQQAKVAYMTTRVLRKWDDDTQIITQRRKTIPPWVYERFGLQPPQ